MNKITIYDQKEINSIMCISVYIGTYHACDYLINGTIAIDSCRDNYKICREEVNKREYYDYRWQTKTDILFVKYEKEARILRYFRYSFCKRCKNELESYGGYSSCENGREAMSSRYNK